MIPLKPFDTYKWRWLSYAPTESLLDPPVLLGVLRVMARHENKPPASPEIAIELAKVQAETRTPVDLVRTPERNLIRNSGQYWKGMGLLTTERGEIHVTTLGRRVAEGRITQGEFAAIMVQQTILPNRWTYTPAEIAKWKLAKLEIRPLALILEIIVHLGHGHGGTNGAFLTTRELIRVVIPLAGAKTPAMEIAKSVALFRRGEIDVSKWPNCTPEANDERLAREFLLFLSKFGLCRKKEMKTRLDDRYCLDELFDVKTVAMGTTASIFAGEKSVEAVVEAVRHSALPSIIERSRTMTTVLSRPGQAKFRERILSAYAGRCLLTGEEIAEILEAAHIIPFEHGGADEPNNGVCLRVDIHRLYDSGNIRIKPTGELRFSDAVSKSANYSFLPGKIAIPRFVNPANVHWRDAYC